MGADRTIAGLRFISSGTVLIQGGGANRTLNIGASGITKTGAGAITIGSTTTNQNVNVRLAADQTWANNNNTGAITVNQTVAASSAVARSLTLGGTSTAANIINGVISNNGSGVLSIDKTGAGLWLLAGANTFTGAVNASGGGTLRVQNSTGLGNGNTVTLQTGSAAGGQGTTLDLRNSITVAAGKTLTMNSNTTGDLRSTLLNGANNNTWNSNIVTAGTGLVQINAAANSILTIGGTVTSTGGGGTGTLFTRGSGTVVYNGLINLGTDRIFNKTDAGTVIISSTGNSWVRTQAADGQIQIGATNALANVEFSFGQGSNTNGRLEMNGFSQTLARLNSWGGNTAHAAPASTGTNHILRNSSATAASTLTWSTPGASTDILKSVNIYGSRTAGALHLVSNGAGRTEFQDGQLNADSWAINAGTIAFTGNLNRNLTGSVTGAAGTVIEKAGTGSLVASGTWNHSGATDVTGGILGLSSGSAGTITVSDLATLSTGIGSGVTTASSVTFGTAGATSFVPVLTAPTSAASLNTTTLTTAGTTVAVSPQGAGLTTGTYPLIDYGTIGGNGFGGFSMGPAGSYPHMTATLVDNTVDGRLDLNVSAVDSLIWAGNTNNTWDINTTSNFALASSTATPATFYTGDSVLFGDTSDVPAPSTAVTNRTITGSPVEIGTLTFANTTGNDYSVANVLGGIGGINKTGSGTVTLSGANTYSGPTNVSNGTLILSGANSLGGAVSVTGGTLRIGNGDALRGASSVTVGGGGTFDANGTAVGNRLGEISFSGTGVGGNGAIVNNGAAITNNSHFTKFTMTGDATWGGSGRYDLVAGQIFNGGSFTLTKTGSGELWFNPSPGSTLENVTVNGGAFGSQSSNPLSSTATVTVNNGGTHQFYSTITNQHNVALNDGGIFRSTYLSPTLTGQVTLNGSDANRFIQGTSGNTLILDGKVTGTGGFTVNDAGTVRLQNASNDYQGDTVLNAGTLHFGGTSVLPSTTDLIFGGGTLDPANRTHTVASISGASGSINQGTAGTGVVVSTQSTATTFDGTVNRVNVTMNGSGSLTLGGTADNVAGNATVNTGTLILAKGNTAPALQAVHAVATGGLTINGGTAQLAGAYDNVNNLGTGANLAPAGFNTTTYGDQIYNAVGVVLNAGTFDLNGREEAINTLTNPGGAGGTVTNTSATAAKLYIGHQNGASTFDGAINNGTGTVAIEKIGTGAMTLTGTSNFTGGLTQTAGTVTIASGAVLGNTPITVAANTFTLDGTHGTGAIAVNGTSTFTGNGTSGGNLTAASGTTVQVGTASAGTTATTLTLGGLNLGGGANLNLDFNGSAVDKVATTSANALSLSGANSLNVALSGAGWVSGTYPILTYAGAIQGTGTGALTLTTPTGHSTVSVVDDTSGTVNLVVTSTANKWVGGNGNAWDTATTLNWNAGDQLFLAGDSVVFDDTATTFTPNIAANQTPSGVTFDNTTAYTLTSTGAFGIAGTAGLIKKNTGTATISSANTYTGTTDVQAGTLIANYNPGTAQTVFAAASTINVAGGATFRAVANDSNFTLANNLTGSGTVVIDPHLTAATAVRDVVISGNNAGFTGTLRLSPTVIGDGLGTFRTNAQLTPTSAGGATIDVDAGGQAWINNGTFANNFILTGHGYAEAAGATPVAASGLTQYSGAIKGGIGAIRMDNGSTITGNVTLDGSAKIMAYNAAGTISGSIGTTNSTDILSVGGGGANSTLMLTGTNNTGANPLRDIFVNAGGTSGANVLSIGNGGTSGTLGTGAITLNGDGAQGVLRFERSDGYTLAAGNTITSSGTNTANTQLRIDTLGTGFDQNGVAINLGSGSFQVGTQAGRVNASATIDGDLTVGSIGIGTAATGATINIVAGANIVNSGNFFLGEQNGFSGIVNQSGGAATAGTHVRVGHWPSNTSVYYISAGTLSVTANPGLATNPAGTGEQNGGIYLGIDGAGIMNHSGGTVSTDWVVLDNRSNTAAGTNQPDGVDRYNLSGGTLELRGQYGIHNRNGTSEFNFTGGTIKNTGSGVNVGISAGSGGSGNGTFVIGTGGSGTPTFDTNGASNQFTISRDITGAGTLAKTGLGTLNFNAASPNWTGNLQVDGGTVATSTINGGLGSFTTAGRTITVNDTAIVSVGINNVFGNVVGNNDLPKLVINQGGTFSSTRYNAIGNVELNGGTLTQAVTDTGAYQGYQLRGSVTVGGSVVSSITTTNGKANHLGANTLFTVADVTGDAFTDLTVSSPLADQSGDFGSAAGGFTKAGPGTMTIPTGVTSTYTGATFVTGGVLNVDGDISSSSVITVTGGAVSGSGFTPALSLGAGTVLSPGNSPGMLTTGSVTTAAGSFANIEIGGLTAITEYDRIATAGTVSLDSTLVVSFSFAGAQAGDTFDIWLNDGTDPITGTFAGLAEGSSIPAGMGSLTITYFANADGGSLGNDVRLTYVPEPSAALLAGAAALLAAGRRRRVA